MATEAPSAQLTVVVRVRPLNESEKQRKAFQCVYPLDEQRVLLVDPEKFENNVLRQNRQHEREFIFDSAFGPTSTHAAVHERTTRPLIDYFVSGYNATVFAYGPTGSGKTYTMVGTRERPGLMSSLLRDLYDKINPNEFTVYISFLEIYNEVIRDLLNTSSGSLDLLEDERGNVQVPGLSRVRAPNINRIMQILQEGNSRRTQEPTAANQSSSRSHALLQVTLYKHSVQHGKLFLIDLAGSERASQTQNSGLRLKEGASINRSLLALGNVINALSSGNRVRYVNYRDSKLTRLLKDSLGGNSKTYMIAHVTPSSTNYDETYNTLVYADRAKNITTRLTQNRNNRPASADLPYSEAIKQIRRDATRRPNANGNIPHSSSTNQLSNGAYTTNSLPKDQPPPTLPRWTNSNAPATNANDRRFTSLFNSLKEQFLANCEKQQKLRQRLLKANREAYDVEMNRSSKMAILVAWEKHTKEDEEKYSDIIERIKNDSNDQETRLSQLQDIRQKVERALRKNTETLKSLETRMRSLARDSQQMEFVDLLVRMAQRDAERMAAASDAALQDLRIRRQESSLLKIQKYEQVADKLINGGLSEEARVSLQQEYRIIKNQLNYHLTPLKNNVSNNAVSWNTQLLSQMSGTDHILPTNVINGNIRQNRERNTSVPELDKTYAITDREKLFHLPEINTPSDKSTAPSESQSDYGAEDTSQTSLPAII
ncbi:kinesin motor domain-containing protein [Ditylenchus destructor]|nr:kinesin motor domain-containing protein [Ditylenchus destructor]